jgi:hypothetical protein
MPKTFRFMLVLAAVAALVVPATATAGHTTDPRSRNLIPLGHSPWTTKFSDDFNYTNDSTISDIAFWGRYAIQGSYSGFRFVDISDPNNPVTFSDTICGNSPPYSSTNSGNTNSQGDITISPDGNVLVRSQDSARVLPGNDPANACQPGTTAPTGTPGGTTQIGWEGLQIFDVSNKAAPRFVKAVFTDFGSHTHTQYYDRANNRLIIYVSRGGQREGSQGANAYQPPPAPPNPYGGQNWPAANGCITAVEVPLANLAASRVVNRCIPAGTAAATVTPGGCHDVAVNERLKRLYGACRPNMILWDISDPVNPVMLHDQQYPGITGWHTASMSWNGQYLYAGWEPGGGTQPRCQATGSPLGGTPPTFQTDAMKTIFVFRASDGVLVGRWVLPQEQSDQENCTIHNYNLVPFADRHVLVGDGYQAGNYVVDFTDPTNPQQIAWSDPPCYDANPGTPGCQAAAAPGMGGDADPGEWSTHWYNGNVIASDIIEGINIWDVAERWWENAPDLPFLNPQTQTSLTCTVRATGRPRATRRGVLHVRVGVNGQALSGIDVMVRGAGVRRSAQTNASGMAMFTLKPTRAGTLRITADELNIDPCRTTRSVRRAPSAGGVAGTGAGGGAGLTGRPA